MSSADECPTCEGMGYVDLSVAAFTQLGTEDEGMVRFLSLPSFTLCRSVRSWKPARVRADELTLLQFPISWSFKS
jgi:hypothetical protein